VPRLREIALLFLTLLMASTVMGGGKGRLGKRRISRSDLRNLGESIVTRRDAYFTSSLPGKGEG